MTNNPHACRYSPHHTHWFTSLMMNISHLIMSALQFSLCYEQTPITFSHSHLFYYYLLVFIIHLLSRYKWDSLSIYFYQQQLKDIYFLLICTHPSKIIHIQVIIRSLNHLAHKLLPLVVTTIAFFLSLLLQIIIT